MTNQFLPGLGDDTDVTSFTQRRRRLVLVAKWWMRPICWIRRRPTQIEVWR